MGTRTVKVMWDYFAYPLWVSAGALGQASSRSVPVSNQLSTDLQAWSDGFTAAMNRIAHKRPTADSEATVERLNDEGMALANRVRQELTDEWIVEFFDEPTGEIIVLSRPSKRVERRHGRG